MPILLSLPPIPNLQIRPTAEVRERFERRTDKDFAASANDNRSDLFSRWRVGAEFKYGSDVSGRFTYQYANDLYWTPTKNSSRANSDVFEAYVDVKVAGGKLRVGRQMLAKGWERLLGYGDWGNLGRSWDMARFTRGRWDMWAGLVGVSSANCQQTAVAGSAFASAFGESLFIYKHDETGAQKTDVYTLDHRWTAPRGRWSYDMELAGQLGRAGGRNLMAWAGAARTTYQATPIVGIYAEADAASGGRHGNTVLTFDQVFAGNHGKYGIMDAQGWRNMKGLTFGTALKPTKQSWVTFEYSRFGLWAANDAWYGDNGKINTGNSVTFIDPTGSRGTDVGDEFDLSGGYKLTNNVAFDGGFGVFRPGRFIKSFANTGDRNQVWMYLQVKLRF